MGDHKFIMRPVFMVLRFSIAFNTPSKKKQSQIAQLRKSKDFARCKMEGKEYKKIRIWVKE